MASDILLLWRVFIIWSRDKRVLYLPLVLLLVGAIGRVLIVLFDVIFSARFKDPVFLAQDNKLSVAVLSNVFAETWYSTRLVCYRLWWMEKQKRKAAGTFQEELSTRSNPTNRYGKVMHVLVQSGMRHSLALLAFIACLLLGNWAGADIINCIYVRIIGIATTLIILQLNSSPPKAGPINNLQSSINYTMPIFVHAAPGTAISKDQTIRATTSSADTDVNDIDHVYLNSTISKTQSNGKSPSNEDIDPV
ncbi:hypothetical protein FRB94_009827 [Tulasnella sp. JGI-2019a]|nr:hypothetical protein FRB94_009827 [Tulasnella sp. JGI-2019a]